MYTWKSLFIELRKLSHPCKIVLFLIMMGFAILSCMVGFTFHMLFGNNGAIEGIALLCGILSSGILVIVLDL